MSSNFENGMVKLTADCLIRYFDDSLIFIRRGSPPFEGALAIPGGKLEGNESIEMTAIREAKEETGLDVQLERIVGVYSTYDRDPRGRYVSVCFAAKAIGGELKALSDAREVVRCTDLTGLVLAFDHNEMLRDYLESSN